MIPTWFISQKAKEHITVALTGDGGDELFGGYRKYRQIVQAKKIGSLLSYPIRKSFFSLLSIASHHTLRNIAQVLMYPNHNELLLALSTVWKKEELNRLMKVKGVANPILPFQNRTETFSSDQLVQAMMAIDLETYLPDDILTKVDRASMMNSLEVRAPFLDYRIVEYVSALPLTLKINPRQQKYLLKLLLKRYFPFEEILNRKKMGFCLPLGPWFRKELRYLLEKYLSKTKILATGFLNHPFVEKIVNEHLHGPLDHSQRLFGLLAFQIWHERYIENEGTR